MRMVIVGAGAAGVSVAETICKYSTVSEITVISKESSLPYSPVALPEYIEGKIPKEQLFLWDDKFIKKKSINLVLGKSVVSIQPRAKKIVMDDSSVLSYDKLLIASGASPILPEDLINRKGVFTLRTLEDAEAIGHHMKERVIIYGAGAVATKIAIALHKIGIDVIVLCRSRVLRRLFDEDICQIIHDILTINGVKIIGLHTHVHLSGDPVDRLRIGTQELSCDGVVVALGVSPNTSFVDSQHIRLGASGGVIVNGRMESSASHVYASGDCIETNDITTGRSQVVALWPLAVEQGRTAALNMLGRETHYEGTLAQNVVDVFGTSFASIGSLDGEKIDKTTGGPISRFTIQKDKIVGCQLVGDINSAGLLSAGIKRGMTVKDLELLSSFGRLLPGHRAQIKVAGNSVSLGLLPFAA